jgi:hypothetical protein
VIAVKACQWTGREWAITVVVREGVYRRTDYPVRLVYLGPLPSGEAAPGVREACRAVVTQAVEAHLRKGSLPPGGLLLNWRRLVDDAFPGDGLDDVRELVRRVDTEVAAVTQGEGHGYFHPFHRPKVPAR